MKHKKELTFGIIVFLSVILLSEIIFLVYKSSTAPTFSYKATSEAEIKDELIITLFMDNIREDSNAFYNNYFSTELEYFNYEFNVKDIAKKDNYIHITFGITPMYGAHNPVGYDELTYKVDVFGNKSLEKYNHLKSYEIPERYHDIIIKPLP